jgi:hypothetical protein
LTDVPVAAVGGKPALDLSLSKIITQIPIA